MDIEQRFDDRLDAAHGKASASVIASARGRVTSARRPSRDGMLMGLHQHNRAPVTGYGRGGFRRIAT
jgi:hypothetical protein